MREDPSSVPSNPVIDDQPFTDTRSITDTLAITSPEASGVAPSTLPVDAQYEKRVKAVATLVLYDSTVKGLRAQARADTLYRLKSSVKPRGVRSWQGFAKVIQEYKSIGRLVLHSHGSAGAIKFGKNEKGLRRAAEELRDRLGTRKPEIKRIDFETCNVARGADEIIPFARLFNTSVVTAWNHYHVIRKQPFRPKKDESFSKLESRLERYRGYLLEGMPPVHEIANSLAQKPRDYTLWVEWFLEKTDASSPELPPMTGERRRVYKPRSDAILVEISSDRADELVGGYEKAPTVLLEHVTIHMSRP